MRTSPRIVLASALGGLMTVGALAGSCDCGGARSAGPADGGSDASTVDAGADAMAVHDASTPAEDAEAGAPADDGGAYVGWHRWQLTPPDCDVMVPDDLAKVDAVPWEPCPFMKDGCERATAPWAEKAGGGYGGSLFVARGNGSTYLSVLRATQNGVEMIVLRNKAVIGAWRYPTSPDVNPQCVIGGGVTLRPGGTATAVVRRLSAMNTPDVFFGPADQLMTSPKHVVIDAKVPVGVVADSSDKSIALELIYDRFAVYDLATGFTELPVPGHDWYQLTTPTPIGSAVIYSVYTGGINDIWVRNAPGNSIPFLSGDPYSYDWFDSDGVNLVYDRSTGYIQESTFETVEVFASPVATDPTKLVPKKIFTMPPKSVVPALCVGEGWVTVGTNEIGNYVVRISDGQKRKLPDVPGLLFHTFPRAGMAIAGGRVWTMTSLDPGAANDMRFITSFEIDKLPLAP